MLLHKYYYYICIVCYNEFMPNFSKMPCYNKTSFQEIKKYSLQTYILCSITVDIGHTNLKPTSK